MIGRSACIGVAVAGLMGALATSCSVDERPLALAAAIAGTAGVSGAGSSGSGGAAGEPADAAPVPLPICDYGDGVQPGCETLVPNPGFEHDATGWSPEEGSVAMSWTAEDANGNKKSGALSVLNSLSGAADGVAARGAAACLPTSAGKAYGMAADIFIPDKQGSGIDGGSYSATAGLSVIFYSSDKCDGYTLANSTSDLLEDAAVWAHREGHAVAPEGANSMSMRLVTFKNFREYKFEARFDNVLLKEE